VLRHASIRASTAPEHVAACEKNGSSTVRVQPQSAPAYFFNAAPPVAVCSCARNARREHAAAGARGTHSGCYRQGLQCSRRARSSKGGGSLSASAATLLGDRESGGARRRRPADADRRACLAMTWQL
jgi:hypothetical protein